MQYCEPIINEETRLANLTNEVGAFDKITLLKNGAGMFIIQRLKTECEESLGREVSWKEIDEIADSKTENIPVFLVQDSKYFNPISMSDEIWSYFKQTNQVTTDKDWVTLFRSFDESMACSYAETIREIETFKKKDLASLKENIFVNKKLASLAEHNLNQTINSFASEKLKLKN